jgi:hypothetical protein
MIPTWLQTKIPTKALLGLAGFFYQKNCDVAELAIIHNTVLPNLAMNRT